MIYRVMFVYEVEAHSEEDAFAKCMAKQQHPIRAMPDVRNVDRAAMKISNATTMERKNHGNKEVQEVQARKGT